MHPYGLLDQRRKRMIYVRAHNDQLVTVKHDDNILIYCYQITTLSAIQKVAYFRNSPS